MTAHTVARRNARKAPLHTATVSGACATGPYAESGIVSERWIIAQHATDTFNTCLISVWFNNCNAYNVSIVMSTEKTPSTGRQPGIQLVVFGGGKG